MMTFATPPRGSHLSRHNAFKTTTGGNVSGRMPFRRPRPNAFQPWTVCRTGY